MKNLLHSVMCFKCDTGHDPDATVTLKTGTLSEKDESTCLVLLVEPEGEEAFEFKFDQNFNQVTTVDPDKLDIYRRYAEEFLQAW